MTEESKEVDPTVNADVVQEVSESIENENTSGGEVDEQDHAEAETQDAAAEGSSTKKKKSKKAKIKKALGALSKDDGGASSSSSSTNPASKLTTGMVEQLLEMNPSLKGEVAGMDKERAAEALKKLDVADLLTGMVRDSIQPTSYKSSLTCFQSVSGKNQKDMASYKFWQTQPVPRFGQ